MSPTPGTCPAHDIAFREQDRRLEKMEGEREELRDLMVEIRAALREWLPGIDKDVDELKTWRARLNGHAQAVAEAEARFIAGHRQDDAAAPGPGKRVGGDGKAVSVALTYSALRWLSFGLGLAVLLIVLLALGDRFFGHATKVEDLVKRGTPAGATK